jgi:hypothetical protein
MRRRDLLAYVIGAAVAGTALLFPYAGRALVRVLWPSFVTLDAPFYLLPIAWGVWNVLWVRFGGQGSPPRWGALLGIGVATAGNVLMAVQGAWAPALLLLFAWIPLLYAIAWTFVVVPLNQALDVDR